MTPSHVRTSWLVVAALALVAASSCREKKTSHRDDDADDDMPSRSAASSSSANPSPSALASATGSARAPAPVIPAALTKASRRVVCEGPVGDIQIDVYLTHGTARLDAFAKTLELLLAEYRDAELANDMHSRLKFRFIEPKSPEQIEEAKKLGLQQQAVAEPQGGSVLLTQAFSGLVIKHAAEQEVIAFWPPDATDGLEYFLTMKLREVRDRAEKIIRRIGVVAHKDELALSVSIAPKTSAPASMVSLFAQYFPAYKLEAVDLRSGEAAVDEGLRAVIVTQPQKKYSEKELRRLDDFLMRGDRALVVYASAVNVAPADPQMRASLDFHGLDVLLRGYGIEMTKDVVLDYDGGLTYDAQSSAGTPLKATAPGIPLLDDKGLDTNTPFFYRFTEQPFPFASSLELTPAAQPAARMRVVATTHARSVSGTAEGVPLMLAAAGEPMGSTGPKVVAAYLDGTLRSAFDASRESKTRSRVFVVASSEFLANPFVLADAPGPANTLTSVATRYAQSHFLSTIMSFRSTLDWMSTDLDTDELGATFMRPPMK